MARPRSVTFRAGDATLRIEYLHGRRALRFGVVASGKEVLPPTELGVAALCKTLGMAGDDVPASSRYLLCAGRRGTPSRALRDVASVYEDRSDALAAFHRLREEARDDGAWAEVVQLDDRGRLRRLCWFNRTEPDVRRPWPLRRLGQVG